MMGSGTKKAVAVSNCLEGPISRLVPASALRTHFNAKIFLDREAAAGLSAQRRLAASKTETRFRHFAKSILMNDASLWKKDQVTFSATRFHSSAEP